MVCEQATKGREEGEGGGLFRIPASYFTIIPHSVLLPSLLRIPFFFPNTASRDFSQSRIPSRHFAFTRFPHYPDPENTFPDPVRSRRRSCKKAKGDLISFMGFRSLTVSCIVRIMLLRALIFDQIK